MAKQLLSANARDYRQLVRSALRYETAVHNARCIEPETLVDWSEQGDAHPDAENLLDHLYGCAYCRKEYTDLRMLIAWRAATQPTMIDTIRPLRGRAGTWARELIAQGITTPIASVRAALQRLDPLALETSRNANAVLGAAETSFALRPAFTVIRPSRPTLRWSVGRLAQEYEVVVMARTGPKRDQTLPKVSAGSALTVTLPETASLKPGGVYQWQVIARNDGRRYASTPVGVAVMTDAARRRMTALEEEIGEAPLGRIGLYEAYGLYDEALVEAERLLQLHPSDPEPVSIHAALLARTSGESRAAG